MFKDWPRVINDLVDQTYTDMISLETHLEVLLDLLNAGISKDVPEQTSRKTFHQIGLQSKDIKDSGSVFVQSGNHG